MLFFRPIILFDYSQKVSLFQFGQPIIQLSFNTYTLNSYKNIIDFTVCRYNKKESSSIDIWFVEKSFPKEKLLIQLCAWHHEPPALYQWHSLVLFMEALALLDLMAYLHNLL